MSFLELKIPPLLLMLLFALGMWLLAPLTAPLSTQLALYTTVLALCLAVTGIAVALAGVLAFRRAKTTVDPRVPQQSSSLVLVGIYRYSRNPMYLGFLLLLAAFACYLQSLLALALLPLFVLYLNQFQIKPEERFLQQKFGKDYQVYLHNVRRWL
ncbi:isoprenylcysteine carboxylmethyltransferase family protein [Alishewanella sp. BS5-314]|uniref:methyltransferase family protein n=1 Tax=Alishewanella sp. BS5-314 TaxID=2755587 RepID=UPI0021BA982E|nr:isoprenylcysteine carboxylmethyltransferase family protein [Alishewanella sp. BS5-314]MCT8127598.1 isoprenylcysteine carboxylmethyltransferase family protein [Alishewanella sp. BS5-314]